MLQFEDTLRHSVIDMRVQYVWSSRRCTVRWTNDVLLVLCDDRKKGGPKKRRVKGCVCVSRVCALFRTVSRFRGRRDHSVKTHTTQPLTASSRAPATAGAGPGPHGTRASGTRACVQRPECKPSAVHMLIRIVPPPLLFLLFVLPALLFLLVCLLLLLRPLALLGATRLALVAAAAVRLG